MRLCKLLYKYLLLSLSSMKHVISPMESFTCLIICQQDSVYTTRDANVISLCLILHIAEKLARCYVWILLNHHSQYKKRGLLCWKHHLMSDKTNFMDNSCTSDIEPLSVILSQIIKWFTHVSITLSLYDRNANQENHDGNKLMTPGIHLYL